MCGLGGVFSYAAIAPAALEDELSRLSDALRQRGPDGAGRWVSDDGRLGLVHRRLAIIDLSPAGAQPMHTDDGRYTVVFNGEIYNHRALRAQLQAEGVRFRGHSDTEVLLHLYARDGVGFCSQLRGMFALIIWDALKGTLFAARDVFGIKPLYFHDQHGVLRFASQVKALLASGGVPAEVDPDAASQFAVWGHLPEPGTWIRDVVSLPAGGWRCWQRDGATTSGAFGSVEALLRGEQQPATAYDCLHDAVLDSIRHHLEADVPVGVFLSGGIDSSTLAALMAETGQPLTSVTLGFEPYRGTEADETPLAELVAQQLGTQHHTVWISQQAFEASLESFLRDMDQPTLDGLNTWLVSRAAASVGLKVVVSGLGGDEFFGGYPSFSQLPQMRRLAGLFAPIPWLGQVLRRTMTPWLGRFTNEKYAGLLEYGSTWSGAYLLRRGLSMPWRLKPGQVFTLPSEPNDLPDDHSCVSWLEATQYMRHQLLRDSDWASMAHSLELRVPLVDTELVRYMAWSRRHGQPFNKQSLAHTPSRPLPDAIVLREKTGFTVPLREFMMSRLPPEAQGRGLTGWQHWVWQQQVSSLRDVQ